MTNPLFSRLVSYHFVPAIDNHKEILFTTSGVLFP